MKIKVIMKTPDAVSDAIATAVMDELKTYKNLEDDEREVLSEMRSEKYLSLAGKWFQNGEYLTVEIDTDTKTAIIMPV